MNFLAGGGLGEPCARDWGSVVLYKRSGFERV